MKKIRCAQCDEEMFCHPDHGCWCADFPHILPIPDQGTSGCLCRSCLEERLEARLTSSPMTRVEGYFPRRDGEAQTILLINPAVESRTPPLDLLKISGFLKKRGYTTELHTGFLNNLEAEPSAIVFTSVFSWELRGLRRLLAEVQYRWPQRKRVLSGVLSRRLGDPIQHLLGVCTLDEASEVLLDKQIPDYTLVPYWDASILITSKGVCPRECSHCKTAAKGKGVTRLIPNWHAHINPNLPRVEVWDNTLMLTPREHFTRVSQLLGRTGKPVDLVCGITPNGVDEAELQSRIRQFSQVPLTPARLECNSEPELPRFFRLLSHTRSFFGDRTEYRAYALVNGTENPAKARERIQRMRAVGVEVDVVSFTPHDWEDPLPYIDRATGWTESDLASLK